MRCRLRLISLGALACAALVGCGQGSSDEELHGSVRMKAPTALVPLSRAIAGDFARRNPDVKVVVRQSDDRGALDDLCAGEVGTRNLKQAGRDETSMIARGTCVPPNFVTLQDGSYEPLSREFFIYPAADALDALRRPLPR